MATSRNPGKPSSPCVIDRTSALNALKKISSAAPIREIQRALGSQAGLHLVGGTVRDALIGTTSQDIDLAAALSAPEIAERLTAARIRVVETGLKHGTVMAVFPEYNAEVTTFRAGRGGKPQLTIEDDLAGRDFTINALAYDLAQGKLIDPWQGAADLEQNYLRAVGRAADRLNEDPLRLMRIFRFGPAWGRTIDPELMQAAKELAPRIQEISPERVRVELEKILVSARPAETLRLMLQAGILQHILPELMPGVGFEQNEFHIHDVFEHILWVLERCRPDLTLRLTALFHDAGKPASFSVGDDGRRHFFKHELISAEMSQTRMEALKFSNDQVRDVATLVRYHMRPVSCGPAGARRLIRDLGPLFGLWREFKYADAPPVIDDAAVHAELAKFDAMIAEEQARLAKTGGFKLAINGDDLIALGVQPGVFLGSVLKSLEELVMDDPAKNTREDLLRAAGALIDAKRV